MEGGIWEGVLDVRNARLPPPVERVCQEIRKDDVTCLCPTKYLVVFQGYLASQGKHSLLL